MYIRITSVLENEEISMVYYTDDPPQINRRMVAGYYLFLCLVGFAVLLGPTGGGIPTTLIENVHRNQHEIATPNYGTDPTDCQTCHPNEYGNWSVTDHATHMSVVNSTHVQIGAYVIISWAYFNTSCAECHTSGWDNSTGTPTYDALGVNCFACHNSTGYVDYSGETCSSCHKPSGEEHPHQYVPWQNSAHANSLTDLRSSSHAASYCMHCMSTEGFVYQQNPEMIGNDVDTGFDPNADYNAVSCPACHAVHANWSGTSPGMIRAVNATQLCANCHVGTYHDTYQLWTGGPHHLAGVECTDCHGYDIAPGDNVFLNHTFVVNPEVACGQSTECHEGQEDWAINQLEQIQSAFDALTDEILTEASALEDIITTYNQTDGADHDLVAEVMDVIDSVVSEVTYLINDGSHGFHDPMEFSQRLTDAYAQLLNAKAYFYENLPPDTVIETVTETVTVTVPVGGTDTLVLAGGAVGGIVVGLLLGALIGRRR